MFPKYNFDDSLAAIERLGKKKEMNVHMVRYRMDQLLKEDEDKNLLEDLEINDDEVLNYPQDEPMDEFEAMIDEQIALTTAQSRLNVTGVSDRSFGNISGISGIGHSTAANVTVATNATQPPQDSQPSQPSQLSEEVRARIAANRLRALAILEQKKKEAEEKRVQEEKQAEEKPVEKPAHISNIYIDDDDF